jgi:Flp pilus assembly protein TadG
MRGLERFRPPIWLWRICADDRASQIAEFAVSLPLLVLFVIGIFDFSSAITLKQKLTNAARDGARVAAADPASDLGNLSTSGLPVSVIDAFYVVDNYLLSEKINDCGLSVQRPGSAGVLTWTSTAAPCPGAGASALVLTINRGCVTPQAPGTYSVGTCVTIAYPYNWQFGGVSGLFGGRLSLPISITTTAVAFNEN